MIESTHVTIRASAEIIKLDGTLIDVFERPIGGINHKSICLQICIPYSLFGRPNISDAELNQLADLCLHNGFNEMRNLIKEALLRAHKAELQGELPHNKAVITYTKEEKEEAEKEKD